MKKHVDDRGWLVEIPKTFGTSFISVSYPPVRRGDHYHIFKTEFFTVLEGTAVLFTRELDSNRILQYVLGGVDHKTVQINPYVVHAIETVGKDNLVLLVQSDQLFDPEHPDTYLEKV